MGNKLTTKQLKEQLDYVLGEYGFKFEIAETESYWNEDEIKAWAIMAWAVTITHQYYTEIFKIHIEEMDGCFQFEYSEDNWEHIDEAELIRFIAFKALDKIYILNKAKQPSNKDGENEK